jgi:hypothetical protein
MRTTVSSEVLLAERGLDSAALGTEVRPRDRATAEPASPSAERSLALLAVIFWQAAATVGASSQWTHRWREMDSNFQYANTVRWHRATDLPLPSTVKRRSAGRPPPMARPRSALAGR